MRQQQLGHDKLRKNFFSRPLRTKSILYLKILGVIILFPSCENNLETINALTSKADFPTQSVYNTEIIYSDSSLIRLRVLTPELNYFTNVENPYTEFPKGVKVYSYDNFQVVESTISSEYAIYHEPEKLWEAKKNVEVVNKKGEILNTEYLVWNEKEKLIYSDKFVKITSNKSVIYGTGFESNEQFSNWKIKKVKGIININDK